MGAVEAIVSAMKQHATEAEVQRRGCFIFSDLSMHDHLRVKIASVWDETTCFQCRKESVLWNLAFHDDNRIKISSLGGSEVILTAMEHHSSNAEVQENGCTALHVLARSQTTTRSRFHHLEQLLLLAPQCKHMRTPQLRHQLPKH